MSTPSIKRPYSDGFLKDYSAKHLRYEIDMFLASVEALSSGLQIAASTPPLALLMKNGLVEVFTIHLRNLIDFLFLENPQPTDVVASDYCAAGDWNPAITPSLSAARVRANKEIAHLTTARIAGMKPQKNWEPLSLAGELKSHLKVFALRTVTSRLDPSVSARIAGCV